ncbi:MAG: class I SAM-dependent methyltransferase [Thermodesulfobacteriota bacterium]
MIVEDPESLQGWRASSLQSREGRVKVVFDKEMAGRYDSWYLSPAGRHVERMENDLILDLLKPAKGQSLLDVGCGTGNHLLFFRQMGLEVVGVDPSEAMLEVARDKLGPTADLQLVWAEDLPFDDNSFDIVTLITSLEFSHRPFLALQEAFRVARDKVFIGALNPVSANGIHRKVEAVFRKTVYGQARFYSVWELRYMVRRVLGVCKVEWGSVIFLPLPLHGWDGALCRWIPRRRNPFGAFVGMRVEILYTHQAALLPLRRGWLGGRRAQVSAAGTAAGALGSQG